MKEILESNTTALPLPLQNAGSGNNNVVCAGLLNLLSFLDFLLTFLCTYILRHKVISICLYQLCFKLGNRNHLRTLNKRGYLIQRTNYLQNSLDLNKRLPFPVTQEGVIKRDEAGTHSQGCSQDKK